MPHFYFKNDKFQKQWQTVFIKQTRDFPCDSYIEDNQKLISFAVVVFSHPETFLQLKNYSLTIELLFHCVTVLLLN